MDRTAETLQSPLTRAAAAEGVERSTAEAVNKGVARSLYAKRRRIHPKAAHGTFRRLKWAVMAVTLAIYYLTPWIRWDRGPNAPDQAVLIDIPARRFYFFFVEIWPQEVYYLTGLLIIAALGLFLATSLFGRVWCGYTCPQTVWTDLFIAVERVLEGDRAARIRGDAMPWTAAKVSRKAVKHAIWIVIAVLTGGAWVFYFADAPSLAADLLRFQAPPIAYIAIGVLTFTTYMLGGHAREQVCTYMCPWPRIQAAMLDEDSLVVTYREYRGEPRGPHRKGDSWEGRGDCVDCYQCVAVCPVGIDIRDGQQLECITCALCIDACDTVMDRVQRPRGLIAYDTLANLDRRAAGQPPRLRLMRLRPAIYAALIVVVGTLMAVSLGSRATVELNVLRDRNPLYVTLSDGGVRNGYTLKVINKLHRARDFRLSVAGSLPVRISVLGGEPADEPVINVGPDRLVSFRVFLAAPATALRGESTSVTFTVTDPASGARATYDSVFRGPAR
ncbi:MAG TPA: cytochrome c oxidase accessory protein CcoG [Kiloniellales bacterium]